MCCSEGTDALLRLLLAICVKTAARRRALVKTETKRMAWSGKVHALFSW
jgi:hypothetical protein